MRGVARAGRVALVAPTVAAALTLPLLGRASLWSDEAATWSAAARRWSDLSRLVHHQDIVFALYYSGAHLLINAIGSSPSALRLPSAVACIATVAMTTRVAARLTGNVWAGVAAGTWLATNPFFIFYGIEARPYSMLSFAAIYTTDLLQRSPRRRTRAAYLAVSVTAVYLHLFYLLFVAAQAIASVAVPRARERGRAWLTTWLACLFLAVPLLIVAVGQRRQVGWIPAASLRTLPQWWTAMAGGRAVAAVACLCLVLVGLRHPRLGPQERGLLIVSSALGPAALILVSFVVPLYDARYVIETSPMLALLVGAGAVRLPELARRAPAHFPINAAAAGCASAVALGVFAQVPAAWQHQRSKYHYENIAAAAATLRTMRGSGTAAIWLPGAARGSMYYYLDRDQDGDLSPVDISGGGEETPVDEANFSGREAPVAAMLRAATQYARVVVVDMGVDPPTLRRVDTALLRNFRLLASHSYGGLSLTIYEHDVGGQAAR